MRRACRRPWRRWRPAKQRPPPSGKTGPSRSRSAREGSRYWKYPLMSRIRWLKFVVYAVTAPLTPAGTSAAFATIAPSREFSVETRGCAPLPHNVRKLSDPVGTTVAFVEYAFAVEGMPQVDDGTGKLR